MSSLCWEGLIPIHDSTRHLAKILRIDRSIMETQFMLTIGMTENGNGIRGGSDVL